MDVEQIFEFFPRLSTPQQTKIRALKPLYEAWNAQINLISRKDMDHFYEKHVLHSLAIANFMHFKPGTRVLDVGTGGGFPGIPLAIRFPQVQFLLIDSIGKKIKVVQDIAESLELSNVEVQQIRAEQLDQSFDFIVSRAVAKLDTFVQWTQNSIHQKQINTKKNGILYLKGGELEEELSPLKKRYHIQLTSLSKYYPGEFFETKKLVYLYPRK
ncbi:MAG: 16S rRNA (guanine(527)-N(7))-methyltransferase RsmG [Bacteroidetes bacterium]|nr:16S rRNA (guanine(527)-N(7))-methyltransferase RsmG [Bacteroidota bacterium]MBU1580742.1 16S rRNA (guanine(527)-N(7))-methyltransferase RsmG [Bacteroidota bacterium]MBU2466499.1 16S rRNA (guanine(527)-N(7))-methyltransferase RsmG [Bacteroidota bacterium]MBU2558896.1 16S rRNA (guanine(527)-N(7))-methyltransferase RsmG [Bacteroidota bacterium]